MFIYTIGYEKKRAREFFNLLLANQVDVIVDIRAFPNTQNAGYAQGYTLEYILSLHNIDYMYKKIFAPSTILFKEYQFARQHYVKKGSPEEKEAWKRYAEYYTKLIDDEKVKNEFNNIFKAYDLPCFLCFESTPEHCHRRLLVEYMKKALNIEDFEIKHL